MSAQMLKAQIFQKVGLLDQMESKCITKVLSQTKSKEKSIYISI